MKTKITETNTDSSILDIDSDLANKIDSFCEKNQIVSAAFRLYQTEHFVTYYAYRDGKGCVFVSEKGPIFV